MTPEPKALKPVVLRNRFGTLRVVEGKDTALGHAKSPKYCLHHRLFDPKPPNPEVRCHLCDYEAPRLAEQEHTP